MPIEPGRTSVRPPTAPPRRPRPAPEPDDRPTGADEQQKPTEPADGATDPAPD